MSFAVTNVATSSSGTPNVNLQEIAGTTTSVNNGTANAGTLRVAIASDNTPFTINALQSGAWTVTANQGTSPWVISGTVTANAGTGTFDVNITNATLAVTQSGTWNINNITGTISLPTGAATETTLAALNAKFNSLGQKTMANSAPVVIASDQSSIPVTIAGNQNINLAQVAGTATSVDNGTSDAGTQRVVIASDNTAFSVNAIQSGAWTTGRTWTLSSGTDSISAVQSGTWDIGTVTTITNPVTVSQSTAANLNATVVGTGTFAVQAAQSGTWNVNDITGTISLPTGAATEASLAKLTLTQGSTTSGQSGPLIQGAVTTAAPSYTNGQTSPLSLTTTGALRVDNSGATGSVTIAPSSSASNAPSRISSSAYEASHIIKASAGNLYTITGYNSKTTSQFIQVHNTTTVPADTAVPIYTFTVPGSSNFSLDFGNLGDQFSTGIVVCNSSTGPTKTIGAADVWFIVRYQ